METIKKQKRVFNFNLPDDLREYLKYKASLKRTTISQHIIDLIVSDMEIEKQKITKNINWGINNESKN